MSALYPFRFQPVFQNYLWGGERLHDEYGKATGELSPVAESWEIVDHDAGQSKVLAGQLQGKSLRELMEQAGPELMGAQAYKAVMSTELPAHLSGRFPLLFKFLDAQKALSVQVHPDDQRAAKLTPPDLGKTEAWVVMKADPGSKIYAGLKNGVGRAEFEQAVATGQTEDVLHCFEPKVGDCVMIPAGTVHAIGAGLVIAEIQQASNTTYRLHDWNRVDSNGKSRELHIEAGLEAIDFATGAVQACGNFNDFEKATTDSIGEKIELVACTKFAMVARRLSKGQELVYPKRDGMLIFAVVTGSIKVENDPVANPLVAAETMLLPATWQGNVIAETDAIWLEISLPNSQ